MNDKEIRQKIDEGWIRSAVIIEMLGKPREHVEETLKEYISTIKKDNDLAVLKEDYADIEQKEDLFSTFVELDLLISDITKLIYFCFDWMPSSIEIMEPELFRLEANDVTDFLNDLQARLHNVDMSLKSVKSENAYLHENINALLQNFIFFSLKQGDKTIDEIQKEMGMDEVHLQRLLEMLVENNKIQKREDKYGLIKIE